MDYRSPARFVAPLALLVALVAVGAIIASTTGGDGSPSPAPTATSSEEERTSTSGEGEQPARTTPATTGTEAAGPETYTVKSGDTLGSIAESTGVGVEELQELNPEIDPQSLTVGDSIRLRR